MVRAVSDTDGGKNRDETSIGDTPLAARGPDGHPWPDHIAHDRCQPRGWPGGRL